MSTAGEIIACAPRYCGVRFVHQGRTVQGIDCLGLLIITAQAAALSFDGRSSLALDVPSYGMRPDTQLLKAKLDNYLVAIDPTSVREGDIVLLKIEGSPQHLALISDYPMVGELGMIHAYAPARKVVEACNDTHWRSLKPFSPVAATARKDGGSGDILIHWVHCARIDGGLRDYVDIPLIEQKRTV